PKQDAVNDGEYCRGCANSQRQREESDERETGRLAQSSRSVADIVKQSFYNLYPTHLAALLFPLFDIFDGLERGVARILGSHACSGVLVDLPFQVIAQFFVEFLLHLPAREQRPKPEAKHADPTHGFVLDHTARTTSEIAAESLSHCAASWARALRPAFVSV